MQFNVFKHIRILPSVRGLARFAASSFVFLSDWMPPSPSNSGQGYIPRGKGTDTIKGSSTPGGGPVEQPKGGSNGGGQTSTVQGSAANANGGSN
ncbi:hypothetical protein EDD85DRAFT_1028099 [Armillaria nabsnona]|nr:hypothetical protein EDD85DRAFT_1028099 [Armillaria nabsnona]